MIAQHRNAIGGFIEASIGGMKCVLIKGRWVRSTDHCEFDKVIKDRLFVIDGKKRLCTI